MDIDIAGKLFPNITTLIVQLCSTGVMLFVFKKYLWAPVQAYFAKRADFIETQINEAKDMNEKAKKYIEDNTLDLNKNERMDTTGYVSLAVSISKAYGALAIVEDDLIAKVADAWNYMSEMTRFDIPTDIMIKAKDIFISKLLEDEE